MSLGEKLAAQQRETADRALEEMERAHRLETERNFAWSVVGKEPDNVVSFSALKAVRGGYANPQDHASAILALAGAIEDIRRLLGEMAGKWDSDQAVTKMQMRAIVVQLGEQAVKLAELGAAE